MLGNLFKMTRLLEAWFVANYRQLIDFIGKN